MSMYAIERVFWEFGNDPTNVERFRQDPDGFLSAYNLEADERAAIKDVDLKRLSEQGLSPLLALMTWPLI